MIASICEKRIIEAALGSVDKKRVFEIGGGWRIDQNLIDLIELFDEYGFYLKYFDHSKEIAGFSLKEGSVKKEVLFALKELLSKDIETEKIYALGTNINSRLDSKQIFYCDEVDERMNSEFKNIEKLPKVEIQKVKRYYKNLNALKQAPDDEFADYISIK